MQLILRCVRISTAGRIVCGRRRGCVPGFEGVEESGDGEFGAAEEEAMGAAESALQDRVHGQESELHFGGEKGQRQIAEVVRIRLHLAAEGDVLGAGASVGAPVVAAEALSAFGDAAATAAVGVEVLAFLDVRGVLHGCVLLKSERPSRWLSLFPTL